jgi:futalosine hydrolase
MNILVVTSVDAEKTAIQAGLGSTTTIDVAVVGVGPVSSAIQTTKLLSRKTYDFVICAGIAGGFSPHTTIGNIVLSDLIIAADLGAESQDGFFSLDELKLGTSQWTTDSPVATRLKKTIRQIIPHTVSGPILTLSTVTGTNTTAQNLIARYPMAVAEAMEGFGVAAAAADFSIPALEIRSISNLIGPRDKSKWQLDKAFAGLQAVGSALANFIQKEVS